MHLLGFVFATDFWIKSCGNPADDVSVVYDSSTATGGAAPENATSSPSTKDDTITIGDDEDSSAPASVLPVDDAPGTPTQDEGTTQTSTLLTTAVATSYLLNDDDIDRQVLDYDVEGITLHADEDLPDKAAAPEGTAPAADGGAAKGSSTQSAPAASADSSASSSTASSRKESSVSSSTTSR